MLKIKDNVDLKELEKFGFEYIKIGNQEWYGKFLDDFNMHKLFVYPNDRVIKQSKLILTLNFREVELEEKYIADLREAGLVEETKEVMVKMTNRQWLLEQMQNMSDEEFNEKLCLDCAEWEPSYKKCTTLKCEKCRLNWLKSEHIKLSDAERVILENVDEKRKWIARSGVGSLQVFTNRPTKSNMMWMDKEGYDFLGPLNHLFQFIKWEDENPYNIEELLVKGE